MLETLLIWIGVALIGLGAAGLVYRLVDLLRREPPEEAEA